MLPLRKTSRNSQSSYLVKSGFWDEAEPRALRSGDPQKDFPYLTWTVDIELCPPHRTPSVQECTLSTYRGSVVLDAGMLVGTESGKTTLMELTFQWVDDITVNKRRVMHVTGKSM